MYKNCMNYFMMFCLVYIIAYIHVFVLTFVCIDIHWTITEQHEKSLPNQVFIYEHFFSFFNPYRPWFIIILTSSKAT